MVSEIYKISRFRFFARRKIKKVTLETDALIKSCSKYIDTTMPEISLVPAAKYHNNFAQRQDPIESHGVHSPIDSTQYDVF